jgi:hypothetical protein
MAEASLVSRNLSYTLLNLPLKCGASPGNIRVRFGFWLRIPH